MQTDSRVWEWNAAADPDKNTEWRPYDDITNIMIEKHYI